MIIAKLYTPKDLYTIYIISPHMPIKIKKILSCECSRCGYQWQPNNDATKVITCAKCRSPYWNRKKKNKVQKHESEN